MVETIEVELTDPAKELANLGQYIVDSSGGGNTIESLSRCIGISTDDPELLDVLAAIQRRVREVELLAKEANDSDFDQDLRAEVLSAAHSFTQFLHPKHAHAAWDGLRQSYLSAKNLTTLRFFSQTARRYRPLRVIPKDKQKEALESIVKTIELVLTDHELEDWVKTILVSGLNRVHLVLRYLQFFGHETAIAELFFVHQKVSVLRETVDGEAHRSGGGSFWQVLTVLSIVGNLFILPDQAVTAFDRYKGWTRSWSNTILQTIAASKTPPEQRLLPAPAAVTTKREDETPT